MNNAIINWYLNSKKTEQIKESVIDFEQKTLSKDIWTSNDNLKPDVKDFILKRFDDILKYCKIDKSRVITIYAFGSLCGYQYNSYSDLDVQIAVKYPGDKEKAEEEWEIDGEKMKKFIPVGYELYKDLKHPINYYIRPIYDDTDIEKDLYPYSLDPLYDIIQGKWIRKRQVKLVIEDRTAFETAKSWARKIDIDFGELKRDLIEYMFFQKGIKNMDNLKAGKEYITSLKKQKIREIVFDMDSLIYTFKLVKDFRTESQTNIADKYKDKKETSSINIDYKNFHLFSGIVAWKRLVFFGQVNLIGNIKPIYKNFIDGEINQEDFIKQLNKEILPEGDKIWLH